MQAIEELGKALTHMHKARELLPFGKPYDRDHHRQLLLHESESNIRYVLDLLNRDPGHQEKEE